MAGLQRRSKERGGGETNLLCALDLGWIVWIVVVDGKGELERACFVHAYGADPEMVVKLSVQRTLL